MQNTEYLRILQGLHFTSKSWEIMLPLCLMGIDIVSGLVQAWGTGTFQSKVMKKGLRSKFANLLLMLTIEVVTVALGLTETVFVITSLYISFMEAMSVMENLKKLGLVLPKGIEDALRNADGEAAAKAVEQLKDENKKSGIK